jgi:hypothetical protein
MKIEGRLVTKIEGRVTLFEGPVTTIEGLAGAVVRVADSATAPPGGVCQKGMVSSSARVWSTARS